MVDKILKKLGYYCLVVLVGVATYYGTIGAVWTYNQLQKAERIERQLAEVYVELAYVNDAVEEYVEDMNSVTNAVITDMMNNRSDIIKNDEVTKGRLLNLDNAIESKIALVDINSLTRDKDLYNVIKNKTERPSYDLLKSMTVMVANPGKLDPTKGSMGTGVVIRIDEEFTYILTNDHVCSARTETDCFIINEDGSKVPVEPYKATDSGYDMSLLRTTAVLDGKIAITKIVSAKHADRLFVVGHHLGRPYIYGEGVFAGYDEKDEVVQIPLMYGNSGSGIFNQKGELIGLLYAGRGASFYQMDFAHGQIVPGAVLKLFVKDLVK